MTSSRIFIAFEGTEGSGKSTQIELLAQALRARGRRVVVTREPGGSPLGVELRRLAMHFREPTPAPMTELLLYLADRAQHLADVILPALGAGDIVLCDRFSASTIVYQGFARGLDIEMVSRLDELVRRGLQPTLTVLLDCPVEFGLQRARGADRFHDEALEFHQRVRLGFLTLARRAPERHLVVDATATIDEVHARILASILALTE
jgi:dTMP kinase